jgi:transposase InsO family protein
VVLWSEWRAAIPTGEGVLYLDSVLDTVSRRIYGALAVAVRGAQVPGVIFCTDQGSEYIAGAFRAACSRLSISQSMGRRGPTRADHPGAHNPSPAT